EQVQEEVHRYAIAFHKEKRSKRQIASQLDSIKGIGEKTKETLLKEFKSVKRIKEVPIDQLELTIGKAKAKLVWDNLQAEENK
ncbi:MAG: excinuclease ABC subunit C, partial [Bacteroidaceae bacterium]|nr:excinuclease ABC subunit C [Bacteroidaceae bacterium]